MDKHMKIGEGAHKKLTELARAEKRGLKSQVEILIELAYATFKAHSERQ